MDKETVETSSSFQIKGLKGSYISVLYNALSIDKTSKSSFQHIALINLLKQCTLN